MGSLEWNYSGQSYDPVLGRWGYDTESSKSEKYGNFLNRYSAICFTGTMFK